MKKNIGTADRVVRLSLSLAVGVGIFFVDSLLMQVILGVISLFILYEALAGWCAFYALIGKNTCPVNLKK